MPDKFFTLDDARTAAKQRLPAIIFDYIDGAAGNEIAAGLNREQLERIRLQPRVLLNVENRNLKKTCLGREWDRPFGIAPMGMCDLAWPGADKMLAAAAVRYNIPLGLSTMASSSIEVTRQRAGECAWFQLYVGQSEEIAFDMVQRAEKAGYDILILTVDVPMIAARPREQRNGFQAPLKIGVKQFLDFATHPRWSISTLLKGVPAVANNAGGNTSGKFVRNESRGKVDLQFLDRLRARWKGRLAVKGVLSAGDAVCIREAGVDAIYVSNHGGRQLDGAPAAIQALPMIRTAVGDDCTILFDSGIRNGESIVKALALGADFVMLGRPFLYAVGAAGERGLSDVIDVLTGQVDTTLAQIGRPDVNDVDRDVVMDTV